MKISPELEFSIGIAKQAGEILSDFFGKELTCQIKRDEEDFATEADVAAEEFIIGQINKHYPSDAIIAEESGNSGDLSAEFIWTIDPLDGTWNFANGKKNFGTMISRSRGSELQLSVIYNPLRNLLTYAETGCGAYLNHKKIERAFPNSIEESRPIAGWINDYPGHEKVSQASDYLASKGLYSRSLRSCAANVLAIVSNERDCYFSNVAQAWDICPMIPILTEAGMLVTDLDNNPITWNQLGSGFLAASPELHSQLLTIINFATVG